MKKMSIDFETEIADMVEKLKKKAPVASNSTVVNGLTGPLLGASDEVKYDICLVLKKHINDADENDSGEGNGFHRIQEKTQRKNLETLLFLIEASMSGKFPKEYDAMKTVSLKNGILVVPRDWILLDLERPEECEYAGVLETRNGAAYGIPEHYVFFLKKPVKEMSALDETGVVEYCRKINPEYDRVLSEKTVKPVLAEDGRVLNLQEYQASPIPGCFPVPEQKPGEEYPYGAKIIRNE